MGWSNVSDGYVLSVGQNVRVAIKGGLDIDPRNPNTETIRGYVQEYSEFSPGLIERSFGFGWYVYGTAPDIPGYTVGELRGQMVLAIQAMKEQYFLVAPALQVYDISVEKAGAGSPFEVPTTTAISLVAIAVLVVVGYLLFRTYVPK